MGVEIQVGGSWKEAADRTPVGVISAFGGTVAPDGWLICDGSPLSRTTYADLYAVIGTNFGAGDGSTTFNLPNLEGISLTGVGSQNINGRSKSGPALGAAREDQEQGHFHNVRKSSDGSDIGGYAQVVSNATGGASYGITDVNTAGSTIRVGNPLTDGTNGTPRTGAYTHGPEVGVNFIIKY
jgi:microcystin-dependent protein